MAVHLIMLWKLERTLLSEPILVLAEYELDVVGAQRVSDRGEFSNYTYRRFNGLTQSRYYEGLAAVSFHLFFLWGNKPSIFLSVDCLYLL